MPQRIPNTNKILDGRVALYKRDNSSEWQLKFKHNAKWVRATTKCKNIDDAKKAAENIFFDYQVRIRNNLPIVNHTFKRVAESAIRTMQEALNNQHGKIVYKDYIFAINKYLIPFFGRKFINNITYADFLQFEKYRERKMGRKPKASTIGTHNSAFNKVQEEAIRLEYITSEKRLDLRNRGAKAERRPDFTLVEYRQIYRYMRKFIKEAREGKSEDMRHLLRDYVLILTNTGIRHGVEAQSLRWKQVRVEKVKDTFKLLLTVTGKTGTRELVARHNCVTYLKRIQARTEAIKHMTFQQLLDAKLDLPVFVMPDGSQTNNLRQTFKALLKEKELNLLKCPRTDKERTLYSLRHTYATFNLTYGKDPNVSLLATQMGTSSAMIEKHYNHLLARLRAPELSGNQYDVYQGWEG
jgi:hypothetical protein